MALNGTDLIIIMLEKILTGPVLEGSIEWYKRKFRGLSFVVFGYRATGKTTLLNRMRGLPVAVDDDGPTQVQRLEQLQLPEFDYVVVGNKDITVKKMYDVPGEESGWDLWDAALLEARPRGIIFIIDHERPEDHKRALKYVVNMLKTPKETSQSFFKRFKRDPRKKAIKNIKSFLLLVNKYDLWKATGTLDSILQQYSDELREIERFMVIEQGGAFYAREISAKFGQNFEQALPDFMLGMLRK